MDDGTRLPWLIAALLILGAAWFAVAETGFASCSKNKIKSAVERGDKKAADALYVLDNFDLAISTILIGTNIIHITVASIVTVMVTRIWGLSWVTVSTLITTLVVFFVGEMLPKSIAKKYPERFSKACAKPLRFFMLIFGPLAKLLTLIGQAAAKLTKGDPEATVTEDELYDIIEDMTEGGTLDEQQGDLIASALQFGDVTAESILTPRVDVVAVDVDDDIEDVLDLIKSQTHSRLPVYEENIDHVIGVLHIRKFLKRYLKNGVTGLSIRDTMDEAIFVHQSIKIDELFRTLSENRMNMAIVTDNYGGTLGIVTMESILEELVGDIWDEDDVVQEQIIDLVPGISIVDADETVSDTFEHMDFEDPEDDEELVNTLMGEWTYEHFGNIPHPGDAFTYHNLEIMVAAMDDNRILKLKVRVMTPEEAAEKNGLNEDNDDRDNKESRHRDGKDIKRTEASDKEKGGEDK